MHSKGGFSSGVGYLTDLKIRLLRIKSTNVKIYPINASYEVNGAKTSHVLVITIKYDF
jgi:hypothetical protein